MSNQIEADEICGWTEIEPEFDHQRQTFQRRRDNLVVSVEQEGMSCFNVVTLPENYDQDNQVIDWVAEDLEPDVAAETARAFMQREPTGYLIEADEICGWTEIEPKFDHQRQAFRRLRDGLVIAVERMGMGSYNVLMLPESYYQDNQVIDYVAEDVDAHVAAETTREWMEQNNATTGEMSDQTEDDEMSDQTEDDEIEQSVTEPDVGSGVVGDLLIDELDSWHVGICEVKKDDDDLLVYGENGHLIKRVDTDVWMTSALSDTEVKDLAKIADKINSAIASEEDDL